MHAFTPEHQMVKSLIRKWAAAKLEPQIDALEAGEPPYALMRDFVKRFGIAELVRTAFGKLDAAPESSPTAFKGVGSGDPALGAIVAIELSRVLPGFALAFAASTGLAGGAIMAKGTLAQKRRWGLPILTLEQIGAWGMTEPGAGSDAFRSMRTIARPHGDGYVLSGQKTFITNAPYADVFVVYAKIVRDDRPVEELPIQPFVVERGDAGLATGKPLRKMGMHASPTGELFLDDCFVPADRLLGEQEKQIGRESGRDVFHGERTGMAPMCVGIIERCLEIATDYAKQRVTWGRRIADYQLVQDKLARMFMHLQNCENLMFKQLALASEGKSMTAAEASACKLYCARAATEAALDAVQVLGGNGYMQEYRVEMLARDAKLLQIGGGTDEIQIINIARHLLAS
ncbi:MAG TPA: acyl-CoA dehydrogenase family protein [Kofleriaceae bacterium]|nr:acyl-CoA dehydrogenase family protein [Kofleriaceae bacterium]